MIHGEIIAVLEVGQFLNFDDDLEEERVGDARARGRRFWNLDELIKG
jgi:hypothetical protein